MFRWTWRRKLGVVCGVKEGTISLAELEAVGILPAELAEWQQMYEAHGPSALKATRLQRYRAALRRPPDKKRAAWRAAHGR